MQVKLRNKNESIYVGDIFLEDGKAKLDIPDDWFRNFFAQGVKWYVDIPYGNGGTIREGIQVTPEHGELYMKVILSRYGSHKGVTLSLEPRDDAWVSPYYTKEVEFETTNGEVLPAKD